MKNILVLFFFNDTATTEIYTLSLHDALPIYGIRPLPRIHFISGAWDWTRRFFISKKWRRILFSSWWQPRFTPCGCGVGWGDCGRSLPLLGLSACVLLGLDFRKTHLLNPEGRVPRDPDSTCSTKIQGLADLAPPGKDVYKMTSRVTL